MYCFFKKIIFITKISYLCSQKVTQNLLIKIIKMKKISLLFVALLAVVFIGCSSQSSPEKTVKAMYELIQKKDFEGTLKLVKTEKELTEQEKSDYVEFFKLITQEQELTKFEVISTEENGDKATVTTKLEWTKKDGTKDTQETKDQLVKFEGKWYLEM